MKKRVVSLMLTAVMLGSSVVSASAADFNVSDEAELLEQFTDESSADWSSEGGTSSDSVESTDSTVGDEGSDFNETPTETPTETGESTENVENTEESKYNLTVNPNKSWVFFKNDLENLKISANEEGFSEDNVLDDGSSEVTEEPEDITKKAERYNLDTTSLEVIKKDLPDDYSNYLNLDNVIELLDKSETTYISGELVGAYIIPYDGYEVESVTLDESLLTPYEGSVLYEAIMGSTDSTLTVNTVEKAEEPEVDVVEDESTDEVDSSEGNISEEENTDDFTDENAVECTCGSSESNPYLHDWDCPVFKAKFVEECSCSQLSEQEVSTDILSHDFDCTALLNAFNAICTCEVHDIVAMHDSCEVIRRIHNLLCDCGKDYDSIDDIYDNHDKDEPVMKYLADWANFANQPATTAVATGTSAWSTAMSFSYGGTFIRFRAYNDCTFSGFSRQKKSNNGNDVYRTCTRTSKNANTYILMPHAGMYYENGRSKYLDMKLICWAENSDGFSAGTVTGKGGASRVWIGSNAQVSHNATASSKNNQAHVEVHLFKAGTNTELTTHGSCVFYDIDGDNQTDINQLEGIKITNGLVKAYTTRNTKLKKKTSAPLKDFYVGTVNASGDHEMDLKVAFSTSPSSPFSFIYNGGKYYAMSLNIGYNSINYNLVGTVPSGVSAPPSKQIADYTNTTTAVKELSEHDSPAGWDFSGWKRDSIKGATFAGDSNMHSDVNLYGQYTRQTGVIRIHKDIDATASFKSTYMSAKSKQVAFWIQGTASDGSSVSKITTDTCNDGGYVTATVPTGTYTVTEVRPGEISNGYVSTSNFTCKARVGTSGNYTSLTNNNGAYPFSGVSVTKSNTTDVYFINTPKTGSLKVYKHASNVYSFEDLSEEDRTVSINIKGTNAFGKTVDLTKKLIITGEADNNVIFTGVPVGSNYVVSETYNSKLWSNSSTTDISGTISTTNHTVTYNQTSSTSLSCTFDNKFTDPKTFWINKVDEKDQTVVLEGAEFTLYAFNNTTQGYDEVDKFIWDKGEQKYKITGLGIRYTSQNEGKFKIVETKNPKDYEGEWSKEFSILDTPDGTTFTVTNKSSKKVFGTISITKVDKTTGKTITTATDAEFTIYEWNKDKGIYEDTCEATAKSIDPSQSGNNKTSYDVTYKMYVSQNIYITDKNLGKFKVVETKNPTGYEGTWSSEFTLSKEVEPDSKSFTVENPSTVPQMGKIIVNKTIKKSDVHWAFGNPTFRFTVSGTDSQWNEKHTWQGYVEFKENMQADASGNLTLSYVIENVPIGTYEIIEADTLSYKFESCKKVTSNVAEKGNYLVATLAYDKDSETVPTAEGTFSNSHLGYDQYRHTDVVENLVSTEWK